MPKPIISGPYRTFRRLLPYESFLEFEGSTITIPMRARRAAGDPWMEEEIKLKAFMRLEVFPAYFNGLGTREFQFIIRDWDLWGKSVMLNPAVLQQSARVCRRQRPASLSGARRRHLQRLQQL